jgi:hypothetical protein
MNPQKPAPAQSGNLIEAEMQHSIPVKPHASEEKNPIAALKQFVEHDNKNEEGLDQVLQDVNRSVKNSDKKTDKKPLFSFLKRQKAEKKQKTAEQPPAPSPVKEEKSKNSKPVVIAAAALFVAASLSVAAFYAFSRSDVGSANKPSNNVPAPQTASKSSSGSELTANDLKDFSTNIQTGFSSLNDTQDFNAASLSDSALGL